MGREYYPVSMASSPWHLILPLLVALSIILAGCAGERNQTATETPAPAGGVMPGITIASPAEGAVLPAGNITVSVRVFYFTLVPSYGQAYVPGEGHLHYYMDLPVPLAGEKAPVPPPGHFIPTTATSYTFVNVPAGTHRFSVELANNDHAPFPSPIFSTVTVTVTGQLPATATVTTTGEGASMRSCTTDADCVPEQCCHPASCINRAYRGVCNVACTAVCLGPIDCGAGHCGCVNGVCRVAPGPAAANP
jgi:hypothetical protein